MNANHLRIFAEKNPDRVRIRESVRYPGLFVVKYHNRVFYKNLWTPELREMRGLVVDEDWNVVVRPFTKIFNRGENKTNIPRDEMVVAVRKINGYMGAVTRTEKHGLIISTTGSLDSDFVDMTRDNIAHVSDDMWHEGWTYLLEVVDPRDPHIVEEATGAYLIGMRNVETGEMIGENMLDRIAGEMGLMRPEWFVDRFSNVVQRATECQHEGFMVYGETKSLKLKSPYYLTKKLFARIRADKLASEKFWENDPKEKLEEEYYPLVDHIRENLDAFCGLDEQGRIKFMEDFLHG